MKSKTGIYLLIGAVIIIWGVVLIKIFTFSDKIPEPQKKEITTATPFEAEERLSLNYRDPFVHFRRTSSAAPKARSKTPTPEVKKRQPPKFEMKYIGQLRCEGKVYYIVEYGNEQYTISIGESAGKYDLTKAFPDSLHFKSGNDTYCLNIQQP